MGSLNLRAGVYRKFFRAGTTAFAVLAFFASATIHAKLPATQKRSIQEVSISIYDHEFGNRELRGEGEKEDFLGKPTGPRSFWGRSAGRGRNLSDTNKSLLLLSNLEREKSEITVNNMETNSMQDEIYTKNYDGRSSVFGSSKKSPKFIKFLLRAFQQILGDQTFVQIDPSLTFFEF
jgi:hypothetical protein